MAREDDVDPLAALWLEAWRSAHLAISPDILVRERTLGSFRYRLAAELDSIRTIGPAGDPDGFTLLRKDEIYQFFMHSRARGTGLAQVMMLDAERSLASKGTTIAWLACAVGNLRAARFYEKCGWHNKGKTEIQVPVSAGDFPLEVWRFEKLIARAA